MVAFQIWDGCDPWGSLESWSRSFWGSLLHARTPYKSWLANTGGDFSAMIFWHAQFTSTQKGPTQRLLWRNLSKNSGWRGNCWVGVALLAWRRAGALLRNTFCRILNWFFPKGACHLLLSWSQLSAWLSMAHTWGAHLLLKYLNGQLVLF